MQKITLDRETITLSLDKLALDPANVRKTDRDSEIVALAENIAHEGLLQNLGVRPVLDPEGEPTGRYLVSIGGRRLAALKLLVKTKRLGKTAPIPCQIIAEEAATGAGLAENLHRVSMHPADAYEAFARMADSGRTDEEIAARFGISALTVQKRMKLGRLSPVILAALRANQIAEPIAQAYAITTDHGAQERVFEELSGRAWTNPTTVRAMLTEGEVPAHDRRVCLIGLAAYEAAGGAVRRDLFSDDAQGTTLLDPSLLDRLAVERLQAEADRLRSDGWQDVRCSLSEPEDFRAFYRAPSERVPLSEEAEAQLRALAEEADALAERDNGDDMSPEESDRYDAITADIERIEAGTEQFTDETKSAGVVFVYLSHAGLTALPCLPRGQTPMVATDDPDADGDDEAPIAARAGREATGLSAALLAELQAHRTAALRAQVTERPGLALRLLVQSLLLDQGFGTTQAVAKITGRGPYLKAACPGIEETKAHRVVADELDRLGEHQPGDYRELLPWLLGLDDTAVLAILAPLVAGAIDAGTADWSGSGRASLAAQAAQAADLDVSAYWTATSESYFGRVTKAQIGAAVQESGAGPFSTDGKKADVAAAATRLVADTGWLPAALRMPSSEDNRADIIQEAA